MIILVVDNRDKHLIATIVNKSSLLEALVGLKLLIGAMNSRMVGLGQILESLGVEQVHYL